MCSTLERLGKKIDYYLAVTQAEEFHKDIGDKPAPGTISFELRCPDHPDQGVLVYLSRRLSTLASEGIYEVAIVRSDGGRSVLTSEQAWEPQ